MWAWISFLQIRQKCGPWYLVLSPAHRCTSLEHQRWTRERDCASPLGFVRWKWLFWELCHLSLVGRERSKHKSKDASIMRMSAGTWSPSDNRTRSPATISAAGMVCLQTIQEVSKHLFCSICSYVLLEYFHEAGLKDLVKNFFTDIMHWRSESNYGTEVS